MAFHSEIKVNYKTLQDIVESLKKYEVALVSMQESIANMDIIISDNEGKAFDALRKVKHDFDDDIVTCKEEVKDIYNSIDSYVSEMNGLIGASPAGSTLLVDRVDIYCNMLSIREACGVVEQLSRTPRGMMTFTTSEGCDASTLQKMQRDKQRNSSMQAAIRSSSANINRSFSAIERIYKTKIVKFENTDDEHESKINKIYSKYTSQVERNIESRKNSISFFKGVGSWLKDLVTGVVDLGAMAGSLCTYAFCKIIGTEPPKWSKDYTEAIKGIRPDTLIEEMCQSGSDSIAEKGWAYGLGHVVPDVTLAVIGSKGLDKFGKVGKASEASSKAKITTKLGRTRKGYLKELKVVSRPQTGAKLRIAKVKPIEVMRIRSTYIPKEVQVAIKKVDISNYQFRKLVLKDVKKLSGEEVRVLKQVRESVPMPNKNTLMQKVFPIKDLEKYLSGEYKVRGFVSRLEDGIFRNPEEAFKALRLDYKGTVFSVDDDAVCIIRYSSKDSIKVKIARSPELGGDLVQAPPYTGNGFTKSTKGHIVPEFYQSEIEKLMSGSKIYILKSDGMLLEIAEI